MNDLSILFKDMGLYADALRNSITAAYLFYKLDLPQESNALVGSLEIIESFEKQEVVEKIFAEMCKFELPKKYNKSVSPVRLLLSEKAEENFNKEFS